MGAGKTTIGRRVAHLLGLEFFDLDHMIELRCGANIALIFELEGEAGFRRRERALLLEMTEQNNIAVATGGGAVLSAENRSILHERGFVVYLESNIDMQLSRLERDRQRPLLRDTTPASRRERLERLAADRTPLYREIADLIVPATDSRSVPAMARRIVALLDAQWQRTRAPSA